MYRKATKLGRENFISITYKALQYIRAHFSLASESTFDDTHSCSHTTVKIHRETCHLQGIKVASFGCYQERGSYSTCTASRVRCKSCPIDFALSVHYDAVCTPAKSPLPSACALPRKRSGEARLLRPTQVLFLLAEFAGALKCLQARYTSGRGKLPVTQIFRTTSIFFKRLLCILESAAFFVA